MPKRKTPRVHDSDPNELWDGPSKSARKRAMHALQALAGNLLELNERQWRELLGEHTDLMEELRITKAMEASSAKQRQLRHLAKLLEQTDHAAIEDQLTRLNKPAQEDKALLHATEAARTLLLTGDHTALAKFCQAHPKAEADTLTSLLNATRREQAAGAPPKNARLLFRYLRELLRAPEQTD